MIYHAYCLCINDTRNELELELLILELDHKFWPNYSKNSNSVFQYSVLLELGVFVLDYITNVSWLVKVYEISICKQILCSCYLSRYKKYKMNALSNNYLSAKTDGDNVQNVFDEIGSYTISSIPIKGGSET